MQLKPLPVSARLHTMSELLQGVNFDLAIHGLIGSAQFSGIMGVGWNCKRANHHILSSATGAYMRGYGST